MLGKTEEAYREDMGKWENHLFDKDGNGLMTSNRFNNDSMSFNFFKKTEKGVYKLVNNVAVNPLDYDELENVLKINGEQLICNCGCQTFVKLGKTKPLTDDYRCINCMDIYSLHDIDYN
jgi:hypothetical protein